MPQSYTKSIYQAHISNLKLRSITLSLEGDSQEPQTFQKRIITIGSHPDCDFIIDHPSVSRHHAQIEMDKLGHRLMDRGSKNGTYASGIRILEGYLPKNGTLQFASVYVQFSVGQDTVDLPISDNPCFGPMLGQSLVMREIFGLLEKIAPTPATVLIEGESGSGKELVAQGIQSHSPRSDKPFVVFDCSAVSKDLIESELFGHTKGAFTGAITDRMGAFGKANGGTLFLDEIGELDIDLQPVLLRALENGEIRPVGSEKTLKVDVRVVAASNRSLEKEVEMGNFREDLYYRLAVIRVKLPPLRDRLEDLPLLVDHFLQITAKKFKTDPMQVSFSTMQKLKAYHWPGNVRELRNYIERAALLSSKTHIETRFLMQNDEAMSMLIRPMPIKDLEEIVSEAIGSNVPFKELKQAVVEGFEEIYWRQLLEMTEGNVTKAAQLAGVHRKSIEYTLRKLNLSRDEILDK